jgi:hypothetical protein
MKTSKTRSKSGKTSKDSGIIIRKKVSTDNFGTDKEDIREKAKEIDFQRNECREQGTLKTDWFVAKTITLEEMWTGFFIKTKCVFSNKLDENNSL